jgi:multiple sugar transport system permease protein
MLKSKRNEMLTAAVLMAPFIIIYAVLFIYPTIKMVQVSFTNAPLIGDGKFVGFDNFVRLWKDRLFSTSIWNTLYFVVLSVIPSTILALFIALGVNRLKGWVQSVVLACFFLPYILPVSVVYRIWAWILD